ncbi:MAG: DNA-binding response regulator, partial [Ignavibacteriaceae bacterium]|nr:DNA-binding response regulator [Ignavibacteriaceae bacterium]
VDRQDVRHGMELGADDYITKPFTRAELLKAIEIQTAKRNELLKDIHFVQVKGGSSFVEPEDQNKTRLSYEGVIFIDDVDSPGMVKLADIVLIKANDDYTIVTTTASGYILRKTMKTWEEILPVEKFMRVHRSYIINTDHVLRFDHAQNYTYKLTMNTLEEPITVSQRYSRKLRGQLK